MHEYETQNMYDCIAICYKCNVYVIPPLVNGVGWEHSHSIDYVKNDSTQEFIFFCVITDIKGNHEKITELCENQSRFQLYFENE